MEASASASALVAAPAPAPAQVPAGSAPALAVEVAAVVMEAVKVWAAVVVVVERTPQWAPPSQPRGDGALAVRAIFGDKPCSLGEAA